MREQAGSEVRGEDLWHRVRCSGLDGLVLWPALVQAHSEVRGEELWHDYSGQAGGREVHATCC